jgi:ACT domain-containing protein
MVNEELIYRITRAVYGRLGAAANEQEVEALVTDVYRAIDPLIDRESPLDPATTSAVSGSAQRLIVSVFGVDRPGIIAAVTQVLAEAQCSIIDINQTVVQKKFAMVLIADMSQSRESAASLKERFRVEGDRLGVRIYAQREDLFNAMHRV